MNTEELLKRLCAPFGVSGAEGAASKAAMELFAPFCTEVTSDVLGNVTGHIPCKKKDAKKLMIEAHIDEVGLIVTKIRDRGFLSFAAIGGTDAKILPGSEVTVFGRERVPGVIGARPPHLRGDDEEAKIEIADMVIDTGLENVKDVVTVGDIAVYNAEYTRLLGDFATSRVFDDRAGIATVIKAAEYMKNPDYDVYIVAAVSEEVGLRGAKAASFSVNPDVAICVDVTFGASENSCEDSFEPGKGPTVCLSPSLDREIGQRLLKIAEKDGIPVQKEIEGGDSGTDAWAVATYAAECKTALLSLPLRYMHSTCEVINIRDIESAARLIAEFASGGEENAR